MTTEKELLSTVQVAERLGSSSQNIFRAVWSGTLRPAARVGCHRAYRFESSEVERYAATKIYAPFPTVAQVARRLGLSTTSIYRLVARGQLHIAVGTPPPMRFDAEDVERFATINRSAGVDPGRLTTTQVARRLGITASRVRMLMAAKRIVPVVQGPRGYEFDPHEVERFAAIERPQFRRLSDDELAYIAGAAREATGRQIAQSLNRPLNSITSALQKIRREGWVCRFVVRECAECGQPFVIRTDRGAPSKTGHAACRGSRHARQQRAVARANVQHPASELRESLGVRDERSYS